MIHDPAALEAASRIRTAIAPRVHRLGQPDEIQEDAMPKKPAAEPQVLKAGKITDPIVERNPRRAYARKAAPPEGARFGVFDDGSVRIALPRCQGTMNPDEAKAFVDFLRRIGVKA